MILPRISSCPSLYFVCCLEVLVGFKICIILSAICSMSYVPCCSCQEFSVLYVHLNVGKILVTFNKMGFTIYEMYILQVQTWSFSIWGLVSKEWWLSVVLSAGPEVISKRMNCAYCYVSLLLRNVFSILLLGYCEVRYTVIHRIMMF